MTTFYLQEILDELGISRLQFVRNLEKESTKIAPDLKINRNTINGICNNRLVRLPLFYIPCICAALQVFPNEWIHIESSPEAQRHSRPNTWERIQPDMHIRLNNILKDKDMTTADLIRHLEDNAIDFRTDTIYSLGKNDLKHIPVVLISSICEHLRITPNDLFDMEVELDLDDLLPADPYDYETRQDVVTSSHNGSSRPLVYSTVDASPAVIFKLHERLEERQITKEQLVRALETHHIYVSYDQIDQICSNRTTSISTELLAGINSVLAISFHDWMVVEHIPWIVLEDLI